MLIHPDEVVLARWFDGDTTLDDPVLVNHLATCAVCQQSLAALALETADWQAALALTPLELAQLNGARLPAHLAASVAAERWRGHAHLLGLLGGCLGVALSWLLLSALFGPVLDWSGRLINVPGLIVDSAWALASLTLVLLSQLPPLPTALAGPALSLLTGLLLVGLWLHRPPQTDAPDPVAS